VRHGPCNDGRMTIIQPPDDETPPPTREDDPTPAPTDIPDEPVQRAPGADQPPYGLPRDEPDSGASSRRTHLMRNAHGGLRV